MANRFWVGDTDGTWNDANNWAATSGAAGGAGIPTSADDVIFDSAYTTQNCTCDVAIDILSLDVQSTYDGTLDFADSAYAHTVAGNFVADGSGALDLGDSTCTCSGNFDVVDQAGFNSGSSTVVLAGTAKNLVVNSGDEFWDLDITGSYNAAGISGFSGQNSVEISGTFDNNAKYGYLQSSAPVTITATGSWIGIGHIAAYHAAQLIVASGGVVTSEGPGYECKCYGVVQISGDCNNLDFAMQGSGDGITLIGDSIVDNIRASGATAYTVTTGGYDLTITGDIDLVAGSTWNKGTGTITFSGTANQDIDFDGEIVEDIDLDKSAGTVTLTGGLITDSFTGTDGTLDIDGNNLETTGNFTAADGTVFNDTTGGGLVTIGGNFDLNGAA